MKVSKKFPQEYRELIETVCKEYKRALPTKLLWREKNRTDTSGYTLYGDGSYISIVAGTEEKQYRPVVLHELAHHIVTRNKFQGHTVKFWELVFELNEKYGDLEIMQWREIDIYQNDTFRMKARQVFAEKLPKK